MSKPLFVIDNDFIENIAYAVLRITALDILKGFDLIDKHDLWDYSDKELLDYINKKYGTETGCDTTPSGKIRLYIQGKNWLLSDNSTADLFFDRMTPGGFYETLLHAYKNGDVTYRNLSANSTDDAIYVNRKIL